MSHNSAGLRIGDSIANRLHNGQFFANVIECCRIRHPFDQVRYELFIRLEYRFCAHRDTPSDKELTRSAILTHCSAAARRATVAGPVGVEELAAELVGPLVGVCPEVIVLGAGHAAGSPESALNHTVVDATLTTIHRSTT